MSVIEIVQRINRLLDSSEECRIERFDGHKLILIGSFDLSYYHDFEVEFRAVSYLQCPSYFCAQKLSLASDDEAKQLRKELINFVEAEDFVFCLESDEKRFLIVAQGLELREGRVFHY